VSQVVVSNARNNNEEDGIQPKDKEERLPKASVSLTSSKKACPSYAARRPRSGCFAATRRDSELRGNEADTVINLYSLFFVSVIHFHLVGTLSSNRKSEEEQEPPA